MIAYTEAMMAHTRDLQEALFEEITGRIVQDDASVPYKHPEIHTLVWPNGADFDAAILHNWPERVADLQRLAEEWQLV